MKLWIRSQDKESLVACNDYINYYYNDIENEHGIGSHGYTLGIYETKERALEVLTEIQNMLYAGLKATNNNQLAGTTSVVYQMPEK